ncbi:hypothetical protein SKAU_G00140820 [Synaphobranchus kaupii]|uniref:Uncharacterized protein n=1 Tax=Synaphobranchus kaupii TaxID=118154 RepID=A0A9Q1FSU0_SYNKA|nr:hypothetical protein SKAU_G00140820 [Synaphobranchus kaupii]
MKAATPPPVTVPSISERAVSVLLLFYNLAESGYLAKVQRNSNPPGTPRGRRGVKWPPAHKRARQLGARSRVAPGDESAGTTGRLQIEKKKGTGINDARERFAPRAPPRLVSDSSGARLPADKALNCTAGVLGSPCFLPLGSNTKAFILRSFTSPLASARLFNGLRCLRALAGHPSRRQTAAARMRRRRKIKKAQCNYKALIVNGGGDLASKAHLRMRRQPSGTARASDEGEG